MTSTQTGTDPTLVASISSSLTAESSTDKSISNSSKQWTTASNRQNGNCSKRNLLWISLLFVFGLVAAAALTYNHFTSDTTSKLNANTTNGSQNGEQACVPCCQTESCQRYSRTLMDVMDFSADPCNDFYKYACGNWHKHRPVSDSPQTNHWHKQKISVYEKFRLALEKRQQSPSKSKAIQYICDLYHECVNVRRREQLGVEPLRQLLKQLFGSDQWPLLGPSTFHSHKHQQLERSIFVEFWEYWKSNSSTSNLRKTDESTEFYSLWNFWKSWKLWQANKDILKPEHDDVDQSDVDQWMDCHVEASLLRVQSFTLDLVFRDAHMPPKENAISIVLTCDSASEQMYNLFTDFNKFKETISPFSYFQNLNNWNTSMDHALYEVMHFNGKLSKLLKSSPAHYEPWNDTTYSAITLAQLKHNSTTRLDWTLLLNKFASRTRADFRFTDQDKVFVQLNQLAMLKPFAELIANTPIRVLKNSMALHVLGSVVSNSKITSFLDMKNRANDNLEKRYPLSKICIFQVFAISWPTFIRVYVDYVGREKMRATRDEVIEMVRHIKEAVGESLKEDHSWLDGLTRRKALNKLDAMGHYIGFPDWILQDDILDQEVGFDSSKIDSLRVVKGHYARSHFAILRIVNSARFRKTKVTSSSHERCFWFIFNEQAMYMLQYNSLAINFAYLLGGPWFDVDYPAAINYGNVGFFIGHEIFHGFDSSGRHYDEHGRKANWWSNSASEHFHNLSQCFVRQYDGIADPITGVKVKAHNSLEEIIADNAGLKQAYRAFEKHHQHSNNCCTVSALPPFLAQFTHEQLFFISFGQGFCSASINSSGMINFQEADEHPPDEIRVGITVSNGAQMAQAFNCPVGSTMNPKHKCSIW